MQAPQTTVSLLSRLRDAHDQAAWREFDHRYREFLLRFCRRRGVPWADAEDVVQHIFVSLTKALADFSYDPARGRFRDYLYRCARNGISAWLARPNRGVQPLDTSVAGRAAPIGAADSDRDAEGERVWEEEWVSHHYRLAMETIRRTFEPRSVAVFDGSIAGASVAELAAEFGMSEQAVHKVRQRIRDRMETLIAQQIREEDGLDVEPVAVRPLAD
jgi:RNA polymerase sigma factor (sigma-70 family)